MHLVPYSFSYLLSAIRAWLQACAANHPQHQTVLEESPVSVAWALVPLDPTMLCLWCWGLNSAQSPTKLFICVSMMLNIPSNNHYSLRIHLNAL